MPIDNAHRFELLCEDLQMSCFVRYFLMAHGVNRRRINTWKLPVQGCGEQYVREQFPKMVKLLQSRNYEKGLIGIVCTDADNIEVSRRLEMLHRHCQEQRTMLQGSEALLYFIPKRNIETWIKWYEGNHDVDEQTDYGHMYRQSESLCRPAALAMARDFQQGLASKYSLPSICQAYYSYQVL